MRDQVAVRAALLRAELARRGLGGFIVPRADEHQGEYVPASAARLAWLTGFTGSAGVAVLLSLRGAIFVDGRYTLQVRDETDPTVFEPHHSSEQPAATWIGTNLPAGARLGYDPWLHTENEVEKFAAACAKAGGELVRCETNPLDAVWQDRPAPPAAPILPHPVSRAGREAADKREVLGATLTADKVAAAVLTAPDSIAWLLNVRGGDVPHTPLPLSFALLHAGGRVDLFVDPRKVGEGLPAHLGNHVVLHAPDAFGPALDALGRDKAVVQIDPASAPVWVAQRLASAGATVKRASDPCALPKACKNPVELAGSRAAHRRDAGAVSRFLAWLDRVAADGSVDEIAAAERLLGFRRELDGFRDTSFETISGAGPNGAIVHYRVSPVTNRKLVSGSLYLVDSGAQFLDGTTDITRTVAIGTPGDEPRDRFTRVLKGHISLATARFPKGTTGSQLDALARRPLWEAGLDFDHGTGHGVGSYLSVHEGPQRISKVGNSVALEPGMILSNEPGYYKEGAYGIRIENLIAVRPCTALAEAERSMLEFETLTLAPIDRRLIDTTLLSAAEIAWIDAYHARVAAEIGPTLDAETRGWLIAATAPLAD